MRQNKSNNFTYIKHSPLNSSIQKQNCFRSINLSQQNIMKSFSREKNLRNQNQQKKLMKNKEYKNIILEESQPRDQYQDQIRITIKSPKISQNYQKGNFFSETISTPKKISMTPQNTANPIQTCRKIGQKKQNTQNSNSAATIKCKTQKNVQDSSQYYKYWKNKANQYQQNNFILLKKTSELKKEIETLRQQNKLLKINLQKLAQSPAKIQPKNIQSNDLQRQSSIDQQKQKTYQIIEKINKQLENQLIKQNQVIKMQHQKINMHNIRLEQLSKCQEQNISLKVLLNKMQDKFMQMQNLGTKCQNNPYDIKNIINQYSQNQNVKSLKSYDASTNPNTISIQHNGEIVSQNMGDIQKRLLKRISYQIPHTQLIDGYSKVTQTARRYTQDKI